MNRSKLAGVSVGLTHPVRIMGVVNVSPESFYKGSVPRNDRALVKIVNQMEKDGADFIDIGAMSTAPYLETQISETEEARRLTWATRIVKRNCSLPISIDSFRSGPAEAGLAAGGKILNDVRGLRGDARMPDVAQYAKGLILMANAGTGRALADPITVVRMILKKSLQLAQARGIASSRIAIDPGIGFFRNQKISWMEWDLSVLNHMDELKKLGFPILAGVSRKSFIGKITGEKRPEGRLAGSLAATTVAVLNGASIIRTHDVKATLEAVRVAEEIRKV